MTTKTPYEQRAIKFITSILAPIYANAQSAKFYDDEICRYNKAHEKRPLKFCQGYTRLTVIRNDYVVKITYHYDSDIGDNKAEAENYEFAEKAGYEYLFAKPTLFEHMGMLFEIMPKINGVGSHRNYEYYLTREELDFVNENFADLHRFNVGYYKNKPIFIDYSCRPY